MAKYHLYGKDYEVFDREAAARVAPGALISSPAEVFLLQEADRKEAFVVFLGSGGEAYALSTKAARLPDEMAEHLQAQSLMTKKGP